jgi:hypothetical protein
MTNTLVTAENIPSEYSGNPKSVKYTFSIQDDKRIDNINYQFTRKELLKLKDQIDSILQCSTESESFKRADSKASIFQRQPRTGIFCSKCGYRKTHDCVTCLFDLQSPLEQKLFLELKKNNINFNHQYGIDRNGAPIELLGSLNDNKANNFSEVLTVTDFYISKNVAKLCIYIDGDNCKKSTTAKAYYESNIDHQLQELGFKVLRYMENDIKEDIQKVVLEIKNQLAS